MKNRVGDVKEGYGFSNAGIDCRACSSFLLIIGKTGI